MPRTVSVEIAPQEGLPFSAKIANLTPHSMFVRTDWPLCFRDRVSVTLLDVTFPAEVVYRTEHPPAGVVLVFAAPQSARAAIAAMLDEVESLDAPPAVERTDAFALSEQEMIELNTPYPLDNDDDDAPHDTATHAAITTNPDVATFNPADGLLEPPAHPSSDAHPLPMLAADGVTIAFSSPLQYRNQYQANIAFGGIIARGPPLPIGTQRFLGLQIPGRERYTLGARVTFIGEGTIGFMIDSFAIHRSALKGFAD